MRKARHLIRRVMLLFKKQKDTVGMYWIGCRRAAVGGCSAGTYRTHICQRQV